jgi:hypothetical protein
MVNERGENVQYDGSFEIRSTESAHADLRLHEGFPEVLKMQASLSVGPSARS